jgi:ribosomal 50S subunit-recycling heat shock protein
MAQDNPFLSFFESMGTGMEAGAERRSLMQRAERGQLKAGEEVPGLGRTILKGITRAATPASTRLAQDQLKLQIANQALDEQIFKAKQQAAEAEKLALKTKASKEAQAERDNAILFADLTSRADEFLATGQFEKMADLRKEAENLPVAQQVQFNSVANTLSDTYKAEDFIEFKRNKGYLEGRLSPEELASLTPPEAKRMSDVFFGRPISNIGAMVSDYESYNARGATNAAQLVLASIKKNTEKTGQVVDVSPEGRVTIREEVIGGPDKDLSATERSDLREASRSYQELKPILDKAERLVTESPQAFGSSGEWTGAINQLKSLAGVIPIAQFKQDMTRREVETTMDTLVGKVLPVLAGASLGRMTENDAKLLKAPLPKLDVFTPAEVVKQQIDALRFRVSLAYILGRESGGSLQGILDEEGPVEFARLISRAKSEGFGREERTLERAVDQAIRDIAEKPQSEADSDLKAMLLELQRSGKFTKDELKSLILNNPALD